MPNKHVHGIVAALLPVTRALVVIMSIYEHTRNGIVIAGFDPEVIEKIATDIINAENIAQAEIYFSEFEIEAGKLPWPWDHDFGALVLQRRAVDASAEVAPKGSITHHGKPPVAVWPDEFQACTLGERL